DRRDRRHPRVPDRLGYRRKGRRTRISRWRRRRPRRSHRRHRGAM
ncbi:MAG: hypothetical protein AVDCRST_MAG73-1003, partial [uncultured Thermomicrobiales bacterium]